MKLIRPELADDPEFRKRFKREVQAARLVGGFHTAAVIDADPAASPPWMVTEYVPGPSLEALVKRDGPLDAAATHHLAAALAEGLRAIHARGLVHRDLKPGNIIMAADGPRIIDFGVAKLTGTTDPDITAVTSTGKVVGTAMYMSPEQIDGGAVGPASDMFSLGSVLAYAATGRAPFAAANFTATSYAVVNKDPDLRAVAAPLRDVIVACLAKDPGSRPVPASLLSLLSRTLPPGPPGGPPAGSAPAPAVVTAPPPAARTSRALVRRGLVRRIPVPRAPAARLPWPGYAPPDPQVRPARQGWRLLAVAVDGRWLASANGDGTITAWLSGSGLPVRSWPAGARVRAMATGPDDLLVAATDDGRVRAWDVATGDPRDYLTTSVPGLTGEDVRVRALALDRAGAWLAASVDGKLRVWDVADPQEPLLLAELPGGAEVTALAFDGTGWQLAAGDADGKVRAWDLAELGSAVPGDSEPWDGMPWDTAPWETVLVDQPSTLPDASLPHSGAVLGLAWDDAAGRWLSVSTGEPPAWLAASLSPEGGFAAMIGEARRVHVARLSALESPLALDGNGLAMTGVAVMADGAIALGGSDGSLQLWNSRRLSMLTIRAAGSPVTALAVAPNGTGLVASDQSGVLSCYDTGSGSPGTAWETRTPEPTVAMAFSADGNRLVTAESAARAWNAADGTAIRVLPGPPRRVRAIAADRGGKRMAAARADGVVTVWDGRALLWELTGHKGDVLAVAFGPRPGLLVTAGDDETIRTWDLATGTAVARDDRLGYRATVLAVSPASATLAAGCADGTIRLHEVPPSDGAARHWRDATVLAGHVHGVTALSFDPEGRWLASASLDGSVRVWDLVARSATAILLPGPPGWAAAVASADGTWHSLGEAEGRIWHAEGLLRQPLPAAAPAMTPLPAASPRRHLARGR